MVTGSELTSSASPTRFGLVLVTLGAFVTAVSGFFHWLQVLGTDLTGYRLARLITDFGDDLPGVPPRWVGVAWYVIPALAAICWLAAFRHRPAAARPAHAVLGAALTVAALLYLLLVDVQAGPVLAGLGGLAVVAGGGVSIRAR